MAVIKREIEILVEMAESNDRWSKLIDLSFNDKTLLSDLARREFIIVNSQHKDQIVGRITPEGRDYLETKLQENSGWLSISWRFIKNHLITLIVIPIIVAIILKLLGFA